MAKQASVMLLLLVTFAAAAAGPRMEARVYVSDADDALARMGELLGELDVATVAATPEGERFLLVNTDAGQLKAIQDRGYRVEITYQDIKDKFREMTGCEPDDGSFRDFGYFFNYYEMRDTIRKLAQNFPAIAMVDSSLRSWLNKPLYCLKISDFVGVTEYEPQTFINGATHAREPLGTHTCIAFATRLLQNYATDSAVNWLVNNREIFIIPVMNPDGYIYNSDSGGSSANWRKNRCNEGPRTGPGVDLNRNYGFKWGYNNNGSSPTPSSDLYRGPSRFSEVETQRARDFLETHKFRTEMDFHTYGRYNLCNYGYVNRYNNDSMPYKEMGDTLKANNGYTATGPIVRVLYETNGGSTEWAGGDTLIGTKFQTLVWSSELGINDFWYGSTNPTFVDNEVNLNVPNCYYLTRIAGVYLDTVRNGRVINDSVGGNRTGQLDPGENASIWFTIRNRAMHLLDTAKMVNAVLLSSDTMVQVLTSSASFPNLNPRRGTGNNGAAQFAVRCNANAVPGTVVTLRLEVSYTDDNVQLMQPLYYRITIGSAPVNAHDVAATRIAVPAGSIDSGTTVTPACSVANYGTSIESYTVSMKIGTGYVQTASVTNHAAGTRVYVTFPDWTATSVGTIAMSCSTALSGDLAPANDRVTGSVNVLAPAVHDVGCVRIIVPTGTVDSGVGVVPACSVYNYGNRSETYGVRLHIGALYNNSVGVSSQAPGARTYVTFPVFTPRQRGSLAVSCSTELNADVVPANDRQALTAQVRVLDVAALAFVAPADSELLGDSVFPTVQVANYGTEAADVSVMMRIGAWQQMRSKTLAPGASDTAGFPVWVADPLGRWFVGCSLYLAGDMVAANNRLRDSVTVWSPTGVSEAGVRPAGYALHAVQPMPVREQARVSYDRAGPGFTQLALYDLRGRLVRELVTGQQAAGTYRVTWNCRDAAGRRAAPGIYFCRLLAGGFQATAKLLLTE